MPRIASAIFSLQLLKSVQPVNLLSHAGLLQSGDEPIPFCIQIRADVVSHLPGGVAQANPLIKSDRTKPDVLAVVTLIPVPESHVVTLTWAVANGLFKGKILPAAKQFECAYRRVVIRAAKNRVHRNPDAAPM